MSILAYKYRIKDSKSRKQLSEYARACNTVWNFCVMTQKEAVRRWRSGMSSRWPKALDLMRLTSGACHHLNIHSDTINAICRQFVVSRDSRVRCPNFRASAGAKRSLGWVPFIPRAVQIRNEAVTYRGRAYRFWKSRELGGDMVSGAFVQDSRDRWYVVFDCEVGDDLQPGDGVVGIDLGLKAFATLSDGRKIPATRCFKKHEDALAKANRARRYDRVRAIHAKIANTRRHHLHEESTRIAKENNFIAVGNVSVRRLTPKLSKAASDAGWSAFRLQLAYKARRHNAVLVIADERWTTQTCSCCGSIPQSSPKGMGALGMRHWVCSDCGIAHDRDINAARNILRVGLECQPPVGGIIPNLRGDTKQDRPSRQR